MSKTAMITLARAEGLEPSTLGFGDRCYLNVFKVLACKLWRNSQRTLGKSANRFLLISLLALAACGDPNQSPQDRPVTRESIPSVGSAPISPPDPISSPQILRNVSVEAVKVFTALELEKPWPQIRIVEPGHKQLPNRSHYGKAVVFEGGKEAIYLSKHMLRRQPELLEKILAHESAHIKAWRLWGLKIREHGNRFKASCIKVTRIYNCRSHI